MQPDEKLPKDLTDINLLAYLYNAWGKCGCTETDEMAKTITRLLEWVDSEKFVGFDKLYPESGIFYILIGRMDCLDLVNHGTSLRYPFLTPDGERLLAALKATTPENIEAASGKAYDGCRYGMF